VLLKPPKLLPVLVPKPKQLHKPLLKPLLPLNKINNKIDSDNKQS
jgi:hypothetical protein